MTMSDGFDITVSVNGSQYERRVEPRLLLSDFLRHELGLTGTHVGCEHGVCGACTVLLDGEPVRSCLMFAVQAHGHDITTVEALGTPAVWLLYARHTDDACSVSGTES
jgi:carbon-monoxide dehydrogenase small subunit